MDTAADDLLAQLGVVLPTKPTKEEREKKRFTAWSDSHSMIFGGYVVKVRRVVCESCEDTQDELVGIFTEELHPQNHTRRLTQLSRKAQFPTEEGQRYEVEEERIPFCCGCLRDLGFNLQVEAPKVFSLKIPSGESI